MKLPLILGTGLSGLVGSRITELLRDDFSFEDLSFDIGVDITNRGQIAERIAKSPATHILHLAAKADVDGCELDKAKGQDGVAWKVNVKGTENVVTAAHASGKQVIYISTDFVFDGSQESYSEDDMPSPVNWYGLTKREGEKITLTYPENCVMRLSYPYAAKNTVKRDFLHAVAGKLAASQPVQVLTDHFFTPTFIDDIAAAIEAMVQTNASGVYHVVGSESLTPFAAAEKIAHTFSYSPQLIQPTTIAEYFSGRANRPYKLQLKNAKISSLRVNMHAFSTGLELIKQQGFLL